MRWIPKSQWGDELCALLSRQEPIIPTLPGNEHWRWPIYHQTRPDCPLQSDAAATAIAMDLTPE
jgi:hypothetical protein